MKVINQDDTTKKLYILPRSYNSQLSTVINLTNRDTNEDTVITPDSIDYESNNLVISFTNSTWIEGDNFEFEVVQSDVIFKGTIFVTNQNAEIYTINKDEFTADVSGDDSNLPIYYE